MRILTLSSLLLAGLSTAAFAQTAPETPPAAEAPAPAPSPTPDVTDPANPGQTTTDGVVDANHNGVADSEELNEVKKPEPR